MLIDRVAASLFARLRTLAMLCLGVALLSGWLMGLDAAWPSLRAAALMGLAGYATSVVGRWSTSPKARFRALR